MLTFVKRIGFIFFSFGEKFPDFWVRCQVTFSGGLQKRKYFIVGILNIPWDLQHIWKHGKENS